VPRGLLIQLSVALLLLAEALVAPRAAVAPLLVATLLVCTAAVAYLVASPRTQWIVRTVFRGPAQRPHIALTFDDGPHAEYTATILDVLREHGARATFFVVGERARAHPELVARAVSEGHLVGSHSYAHAHTFHVSRSRTMADDIERGMRAITEITGQRPRFFRPPQGLRVPTLREALASLAEPPTCVTWTVRGLDTIARSPDAIVARIARRLAPGAIVALHDGTGFGGGHRRDATVDALRRLLSFARDRGLSCVTLDRMLAPDPEHAS
jgi:peptidoglycan/xylan/chitin deacetylase (PgdA/CDA1 family)